MELPHKGRTVHYDIQGSGKTVVLLHGFLENLYMWDDIAASLGEFCRVIRIDLLGHGKTPFHGYVHTMEDMADVVATVLQKHHIRKPILIGHSMGGYVALAYADKFPDKVKGLCLLNSAAREDCQQRIEGRDMAMRVAKNNYEGVIRISIRNLFADEEDPVNKGHANALIKEVLALPKQGYFATQEGMKRRPNREHVLKNAAFSKLMITGKKDDLLCLEEQEEEAQRTQTPLIELSEGHMSHLENKEELIAILNNFCKNA